jgi:hypothetical protein
VEVTVDAIAVGLAFAVMAALAVQAGRYVRLAQEQHERWLAEQRQLGSADQDDRAAELWRWNHPAQRDRGTLKA